MRKDRSVIEFFQAHRWLLTDQRFSKEAAVRLTSAQRRLASTTAKLDRTRAAIDRERQLAALSLSPEKTICSVFGSYCQQALQVARCESGSQTTAQNGQYLGLFQMGSNERRLFGHGPTALEQAKAAFRYFVVSGRDWSPWSCKPWA